MKATLLGVAFFFSGCVANNLHGPSGGRGNLAEATSKEGFVQKIEVTEHHAFVVLHRPAKHRPGPIAPVKPRGSVVNVYIEGDGAVWPTPWHPPLDPTPDNPVALNLARVDSGEVIYLGRPCQYLDKSLLGRCRADFWTHARFDESIALEYSRQLDLFAQVHGPRKFRLIGFSGGGVLALQVAQYRLDVLGVATIASPIALNRWATHHQLEFFPDHQDPDSWNKPISNATHFIGGRDKIIPAEIVRHYAKQRGDEVRTLEDFDHDCCWRAVWPSLLQEISR